MKREECGLGQEARRHQRGRHKEHRLVADSLGQQSNVERAESAVKKSATCEIEHGAQQREQEIFEYLSSDLEQQIAS